MHQTDDDSSPSVGTPPDWNSFSSMWPSEDRMYSRPCPRCSRPESESGSSTSSSSPPLSMRAASVDTGYSASSDDPAAELANRVRKNTSLVLAAQIGSDSQYQPHQPSAFTAPPAPSYPTPNTAASAFTTAPVTPSAPPTPATPVRTATQSRPKTSHTTIERRYRTNVNARIQSLRQAVPALRVVDRAAAIKAGEPYPGGGASDPEDHIDARGFVDGVKVARKCQSCKAGGGARAGEEEVQEADEGRAPPCVRLRPQARRTQRARRQRWSARDCPISLPLIPALVPHALPSFPTPLFPSDPPPSRHCRTPTPSSRALHGGCICRMHALRAALVPISLVFTLTLPPPYYPPCSPPSSRVQLVLALGSDAMCRVPALVHFSLFFTLSPVPATPACAVESSADCTKLDSAVVLLARGDARAEFARTHCADVRPLCCIPAPSLSSLPSPSLPF
ncbi:hypothetical protein B0H16DRAFT_1797591 [Mycena metata]|uniref:BHLH domain-containing protein n=1 Tax=Mycena metata TaxID=1033252 RepID=A0AAD7MI12_9AGAR|nr:hypothetical protein B0H16DRAFT_1797591 [Mycena metata]